MGYQIIATLGPASREERVWNGLAAAGATGFRLNTSHLSVDELEGWLERLSRFYESAGVSIPLVLDLQGSKWRLGAFTPFALETGALVTLIEAEASSQPSVLPVPHADFFRAAASSGEVVLNDAKVRLRIETAAGTLSNNSATPALLARVVQGGMIGPRKGITLAHSEQRAEALSRKDQQILARVGAPGFVQWAISYVKDAHAMQDTRLAVQAAMEQPAAAAIILPEKQPAVLIAKLEREPAVTQAAAIAAHADALWLCRGDLGAEMGLAPMAAAVQRFSAGAGGYTIPVLMAGQVLEHMTGEPTPTRSEVCYLYDTLSRGYSGFVLSDETATGRYPVESCQAAAMFLA